MSTGNFLRVRSSASRAMNASVSDRSKSSITATDSSTASWIARVRTFPTRSRTSRRCRRLAGGHESYHGVFHETAVGAGLLYDIHGSAKMTIRSWGTVVKINVSGLDPAKTYGSHLHNDTCAAGGGGHYQNTLGGGTAPPNELWLSNSGTTLRSNPGGVAHASGSATWMARTSATAPTTNARSVVVHEPGGARIACVDLA